MNQQLRKKIFCLILGLTMIFSQMGFAFADTLGLNQTEDTGQTEILPAAGNLQTAEEPQMSDETQESEEPEKADPPSEAEEEASADNGEDKTPTTAIKIADTTLPQIIPNAVMRMVYQDKEAAKMSEAFVSDTVETEDGTTTTWNWVNADYRAFSYYAIEDAADWQALTECVNNGNTLEGKTVVLMNDVDFKTFTDESGNQQRLQPIGSIKGRGATIVNSFEGIFDGQNFKLQNILISDNDGEDPYGLNSIALFGCVKDATIQNLTVTGEVNIANFKSETSVGGGIAALIGHIDGTTSVSHVINECNVTVTATGNNSLAGGLIGSVKSTGRVILENCENYENYGTISSTMKAAGLIGFVGGSMGKNSCEMINCFNEGEITGPQACELANASLKGFADSTEKIIVRGCYGKSSSNALFTGSDANVNYDKRCIVSCNPDTKIGTYVSEEEFNTWKNVWNLNQGSMTSGYTLKNNKLQRAEQGDETIYRVDFTPYNAETKTITALPTPPQVILGEDDNAFYVADGTKIELTLTGTDEKYPVYTLTELANGDQGVGQNTFVANEGKDASLKVTLEVKGKNITVHYGTQEEYEKEINYAWYSEEAEKHVLRTPGDLKGFNALVNAGTTFKEQTVTLGENIDLENHEWTPIGATDKTPFQGTFDGAGKKITYKIGNNTKGYKALFAYIENAEIKNLTVEGENLTKGQCVAGICVLARNSKIENCVNKISLNNNRQMTAGIVASSVNSIIDGCTNEGSITGTGGKAAGIVGTVNGDSKNKNDSYIRNCVNRGAITGNNNIAGIVGEYTANAEQSTPGIENCTNEGTVKVTSMNGGGIVGSFTGWLENCENKETIDGSSKSSIGGIVGSSSKASIVEKCINRGNVYGTSAGGIAGKTNVAATTMRIEKCQNTGNILPASSATEVGASNGGIVGESASKTEGTTMTGCISYVEDYKDLDAVGTLTDETITFEGVYVLGESGTTLTSDGTTALTLDETTFAKPSVANRMNRALGEKFWGYDPDQKPNYPVFDGFEKYPVMELVFKPFAQEDETNYQIEMVSGKEKLTPSEDGKSIDIFEGFKGTLDIKTKDGSNKFAKAFTVSDGQIGELQDARNMNIQTQRSNVTIFYGDEASYESLVFTDWYDKNVKEMTIYTSGQMKAFAQLVNEGTNFIGQTVKLGKDIDLSGLCNENGESWQPIGDENNLFEGTFDGQNHSISGLYIDTQKVQENNEIGLFGHVQNATISNLRIEKSKICDSGDSVSSKKYVGMLIGVSAYNLTVNNVTVTEDSSIQAAAYAVGGIIGYAWSLAKNDDTTPKQDVRIINVENRAPVTLLAGGDTSMLHTYNYKVVTGVGGIAGFVRGGSEALLGRDGEIRFAVNSGAVTNASSVADYNCAGGIVGATHSVRQNVMGGDIADCALPIALSYNTGTITAEVSNGRAAGISGARLGSYIDTIDGAYSSGSQIGNCFNIGEIKGTKVGAISTFTVYQADNDKNYYLNKFAEETAIQDADKAEVEEITAEELTNGKLAYLLDRGGEAGSRTGFYTQGTAHPVFTSDKTVYKLSVQTEGLDSAAEAQQEEKVLAFAGELSQITVGSDTKLLTQYFAKERTEEQNLTFNLTIPSGYVLSEVSGDGIKADSMKVVDKEITDKDSGKMELYSTITLTVEADSDLNLVLKFTEMPKDYGKEMKVRGCKIKCVS